MSTQPTFLNFAYGSNLLTRRIQARTPSARAIAVACLPAYELRWHKVGMDGSGKCDIVQVEAPHAQVLGVVYEILMAEKAALDAAEGLGNGYNAMQVMVETASGMLQAQTYFATHIDPAAVPYIWYKALVVAGAKEHGFAVAYVGRLEAQFAVLDTDTDRAAKNFDLANATKNTANRIGG